ncbi:unnamed protein product [Paramecium octaurelia]|uniref:Uncharacterized protein n=1 Tax=Paramecium octaurelia TaxID=43137 RepID=A0A8S1X022_PAROT|nr:unnamed protein product [Paramecium octaurelia]
MVEVTMICILFFIADPYCLWKTQFTEQTFSTFPSNWQIIGAHRYNYCWGIWNCWIRKLNTWIILQPPKSQRTQKDAWINVAGFVTQRTWYLDWGWSDMCGAGFRDGYFWETLQGSHTADTFSINLSNGLDDDAYNESLGLKDVEIYLKPTQCVSFFSECNYTGTMKELCLGSPNLDRRNIPQKIKSIRVDGCGKIKLTKKGSGSITITENTPCLTEFDFPPVENLNR